MNAWTSGSSLASSASQRAVREHPAFVQQREVVADDPRARNVVGHDDQRGAAALGLDQQVVDLLGGDRIEAGARLVDEQDRRVERHGPRQSGALLHAARQIARHLVVVPFQSDGGELLPGALADLAVGPVGVAAHRKRDVVADRHRIEQRRVLKQESHVLAHVPQLAPGQRGDVALLDEHLAAVRLHQADDVPQRDALAGAAASEQAEGLALGDVERHLVEHGERAEALRDTSIERRTGAHRVIRHRG